MEPTATGRKVDAIIFGVDPGLKGYVVALDAKDGTLLSWYRLQVNKHPKIGGVVDFAKLFFWVQAILRIYGDISVNAIVERQQPRPGNSSKSNSTAQRGYQVILDAFTAAGIPIEVVAPQTWRAKLLGAKADGKAASIAWATDRFGITPQDDNHAEALCIAEYYRRTLINQE